MKSQHVIGDKIVEVKLAEKKNLNIRNTPPSYQSHMPVTYQPLPGTFGHQYQPNNGSNGYFHPPTNGYHPPTNGFSYPPTNGFNFNFSFPPVIQSFTPYNPVQDEAPEVKTISNTNVEINTCIQQNENIIEVKTLYKNGVSELEDQDNLASGGYFEKKIIGEEFDISGCNPSKSRQNQRINELPQINR